MPPDRAALRGSESSLLEIDELIHRANVRGDGFWDFAWDGVRSYLATVPGLSMNDSGQIVLSGSTTKPQIEEHHGYVAMLLSRRDFLFDHHRIVQTQQEHIAELVDLLLPAVRQAGALRACGIRLVGDPKAQANLKSMYEGGNPAAGEVLANLFPTGHHEVTRDRSEDN